MSFTYLQLGANDAQDELIESIRYVCHASCDHHDDSTWKVLEFYLKNEEIEL